MFGVISTVTLTNTFRVFLLYPFHFEREKKTTKQEACFNSFIVLPQDGWCLNCVCFFPSTINNRISIRYCVLFHSTSMHIYLEEEVWNILSLDPLWKRKCVCLCVYVCYFFCSCTNKTNIECVCVCVIKISF